MDLVIAEWIVGFRYEDLEDPEKPSSIVYPNVRDLYYVPLIALLVYCVRRFHERTIARPIAKYYGLSDGTEKKSPRPNPHLDGHYRNKSRNPSPEDLRRLAKKIDWTVDNVRRWFRRTRNSTRLSKQTKFCESCWRFTFYTSSVLYGIPILWPKPYLWDLKKCWTNFPRQSIEQPTYNYYIMQAGFYLSLIMTINSDVKRKDTTEHLIHHIATLILISVSYITNAVRIGTLVILLHDISDVFLEGAKCLYYLRQNRSAVFSFVMLTVTFFITRLVIYPFWIIDCLWTYGFPDRRDKRFMILFTFLIVLQILHVFWFYLIMKQACATMMKPEDPSDERSDNEEVSSGNEDGE